MDSCVYEKVRNLFSEEKILKNEPMSRHTTFRTGGNADYFITVANEKELSDLIALFNGQKEKYTVIGNGSNLLVSDNGYRGTIICMVNGMAQIQVSGSQIIAGAGALNSQVAAVARDNSLSGFEFASGIPGTVGGAMVMNAGAYGSEMADITDHIIAIDAQGYSRRIDGKDMEFGYRRSVIRGSGLIAAEATFNLNHGSMEEINAKMAELASRRREKQPLEYPSAGSTFKRPDGYFAGKLIMDAGLSGYTIGGAEVSPKHCGFIVNSNGASSMDIYKLIREVQQRVFDNSGVRLEPEVIMLGEF